MKNLIVTGVQIVALLTMQVASGQQAKPGESLTDQMQAILKQASQRKAPRTAVPITLTSTQQPQPQLFECGCVEILIGAVIFYYVICELEHYYSVGSKLPNPSSPPVSCPPWTNNPSSPMLAGFPVGVDVGSTARIADVRAYSWMDNIGSPPSLWTNQLQVQIQATTALQLPWTNALQLNIWQSAGGGVIVLIKDSNLKPLWTNYTQVVNNRGLFTVPLVNPARACFYRAKSSMD